MKRLLFAVLLVTLCTSCDLQGLDLNTPSDARKYVQACGRGHDAIHCRAMQRVLTNVTGEVTVLLPNDGDTVIRALLEAYVQSTGRSADAFEQSAVGEAYAKANIFRASSLQTGTMTTLDGKAHTVVCQQDRDGTEECVIDGVLSRAYRMRSVTVGSVYSLSTVTPPAYLPF
ncbi:hypothetical protein [Deinococcus sp. QL22]|uniref:hypothetical protein n=1 Tax=Deinococcus sp. QL22 TaxID=2939437 RepID=UPI002016CC99|nr:hypothetical protein [Deinococcus sp. QL22]UQN10625.1 hypothetical protein M1R55_30995 [Deinococcus sp. QL22]